ncbi:uncharacterized protein LOC117405252 isoform X3 [Acipenser ruthenus]|uniref:uncharacterized protein LOC117405252 isoform X3 n=1 Tax=Acipenser ruthenus TaxID=7906 RepID=UPI002742010F|nr:uncharacterized protein LOC117405252 isoform X3 [Acipenser ruthenus]
MSCVFCHLAVESSKTGPILQKEDTAAHENCLLFSSGLVTQNTPEGDDLAGFSVEDVKKEINRGRKLHCFRCKKSGATVGCEVKKCKRSYHFLCALNDNAEKEEDVDRGLFRIYCEMHMSKIPEGAINDKSDAESDQTDDSSEEFALGTMMTPVCSDYLYRKPGSKPRKRSTPVKRNYSKKSRKWTSSPRIVISKNPADGDKKGDDTLIESEDAEILCSSGVRGPKKTEKRTIIKSPNKNSIGAISPRLKVVRFDVNPVSKGENTNESEDEQLPTDTDKNSACDTVVSDDSTNLDSHDEKEDEESSENIRIPIKMKSVSLLYSGNPAEFWKKCREASCTEKLFSKIHTAMSDVSKKIVTDAASDHDYKFAMDILTASDLLEVISDNNKDLKKKQKQLKAETDSLSKAQVAMQELEKIAKDIQK